MTDSLSPDQLFEVILVVALYHLTYDIVRALLDGRVVRRKDKQIKHLYEE